jgi:hypothetical protein
MGKIKEDKDRKDGRFTVLMTETEKAAFFKACKDNGVKPSEAVRQFCDAYTRG